VAALIVAALLLLWFGWEASAQRAARLAEEQDESDAAELAEHGPSFPTPPMDLPHYHGIGLEPIAEDPAGLAAGRGGSSSDPAATKEVTGA